MRVPGPGTVEVVHEEVVAGRLPRGQTHAGVGQRQARDGHGTHVRLIWCTWIAGRRATLRRCY